MALKTSTNFSGVTPRLVPAPCLGLRGEANSLQLTGLGEGAEKRGWRWEGTDPYISLEIAVNALQLVRCRFFALNLPWNSFARR